MSKTANLYLFLVDLKRINLEDVPDPYRLEIEEFIMSGGE